MIFIFRYAITVEFTIFYVYLNELFPTQVRVLGFALLMVTGGLSLTFVPLLLEVCLENGVSIMAIFALLSGFSAFLSKYLPETINVPPPEIIEELRDDNNNDKKNDKMKFSPFKVHAANSTLTSEDDLSESNRDSLLSN